MSAITNLWRQLVQRRLWPVAILLVAALAAVPLALAKSPEPAPPAPPVSASGDGDSVLATEPVVAQADEVARTGRRVLGNAKSPFGVPEQDTGTGSDAPLTSDVVNTSGDGTSVTGGTSTGTGTGSTPAPTSPGTAVPPAAEPRPEPAAWSLDIRFGDATGDALDRMNVERLEALPDDEEPLLVYLGTKRDGKTAVFLVDTTVTPVGDGECNPDPETCETIELRVGETEFFDVTDEEGKVGAQYQLDLLKIHQGDGAASAARADSAAKRALSRHAKASGRRLGYRVDPSTGTLEHRSVALGRVSGDGSVRLP